MALTKKDKDKAKRTSRRNEHREVSPYLREKIHRNKKRYNRNEIDPSIDLD